MTPQMPSIKDLDERIQINLEQDKLTLEEIEKDTNNLIRGLVDQCNLYMFQIKIYNALIDRIKKKIKERDSNLIITKE